MEGKAWNRVVVSRLLTMGAIAFLVVGSGVGCKSLQNTYKKLKPTKPAPLLSNRGGVVPAPYEHPEPQAEAPSKTIGSQPLPSSPSSAGELKPLPPLKALPQDKGPKDGMTKEEDTGKGTAEEGLPRDVETEPVTYTVKKGDTLWDISRRYGVSMQELAAFNNMDPDETLSVGRKLQIPPGGSAAEGADQGGDEDSGDTEPDGDGTATEVEQQPIPENGKYTVESGDSLWLIHKKFDIPVKKIRKLNGLESNVLHVGQVLVLREDAGGGSTGPEVPTGGGRTDDTTGTGDEDDAETETDVSTGEDTEGDMDEGAGEDTANTGTPEYPKTLQHTVSADENLQMIADMYETTVDAILKANPDVGGNSDLKANMTITIPYK